MSQPATIGRFNLTLKTYPTGERVLRFEAITHNYAVARQTARQPGVPVTGEGNSVVGRTVLRDRLLVRWGRVRRKGG